MKLNVLILVLSSITLFCGCSDVCDLAVAGAKVAYKIGENNLGVLTPAEPDWQSLRDGCQGLGSGTPTTPGALPASVQPPAGVCSQSYGGSNPCAACVRTSCCAEAVACTAGQACLCNLAPKLGVAWPEGATCADPDDAYDALTACLDTHCAEECYQ